MNTQVLLKYGFHIGGRAPLWQGANAAYLGAFVKNVFIFDMHKTRQALLKAFSFVKTSWWKGNNFLFVEKNNIDKFYLFFYRLNLVALQERFFLVSRWYGGLFSNFYNLYPQVILKIKNLGLEGALSKKLSFQLLNSFPKYCSYR